LELVEEYYLLSDTEKETMKKTVE